MNRLVIKICLVVAIMTLSACESDSSDIVQGYQYASIQQAYHTWSQKDKRSYIFLDVRTPSEYSEGHIPGAINIPIQTLSEHLNDISKEKNIYVYCESGVRASKAAKLLATSGFKHVHNFKASMQGWRSASYPIEK